MPEIQMPKLSDTMTEGTLVAWKKKKGDQVSAGEVLAEIETDKATMEWESPEDGTLTEIYVHEGAKVNVGDKIALVRGQGEEAPQQEAPAQKKKPEGTEEKKPQADTEKPAPAEAAKKERAAQTVAAGVSDRETKPHAKPPIAVKPAESERNQLSGMRKSIAQRLVERLGLVPDFYLTIGVNAGPLMGVREELKSAGEGADAA